MYNSLHYNLVICVNLIFRIHIYNKNLADIFTDFNTGKDEKLIQKKSLRSTLEIPHNTINYSIDLTVVADVILDKQYDSLHNKLD